jgi:hypothetical protein
MKLAASAVRPFITWTVSIIIAGVGLKYISSGLSLSDAWDWYQINRDDITPLATFAAAALLALAALRQARTARLRHEKQTEADWHRRITESFSKAAEQVGNDKLEVRLGGIYTMERISRESLEDYWPVMETLTAFVREKSHWEKPTEAVDFFQIRGRKTSTHGQRRKLPGIETTTQRPDKKMPTDIAAVLAVIGRRGKTSRKREKEMGWSIDLRNTDLRQAPASFLQHLQGINLAGANLDGANLCGQDLEGVDFSDAQLEQAALGSAHFEKAVTLEGANLREANMWGAHLQARNLAHTNLEKTTITEACLQGANLQCANLAEANLYRTHLEGADLRGVKNLTSPQLKEAHIDKTTKLTTESDMMVIQLLKSMIAQKESKSV